MGSKGVNEGHANSRLRPRIKTLKARREKLRRFIGLFAAWLIITMPEKNVPIIDATTNELELFVKCSFVKSTLCRQRKKCMDNFLRNILFEKDCKRTGNKKFCVQNFDIRLSTI